MFRACSIVSHVFYVIQKLQLALHNEHDNTLSSVLEVKLLSTLNYIQNCSKVVTNTEPKEMWECSIHVYLFTLVNLLLFVCIIGGTNMYTLNLPVTGQPIVLSCCRLCLHARIQNSSYYIRNSYNMYILFFIFCDDLYDCKDDNMLLIYKYRKLNISENNVYTNKIQYEHYYLIPIEKWNNRILKCNHISNFKKKCVLVLYIISILCVFISWSMYLLEHFLYFIYVLDIIYLLEIYLYTYADTVNTYSPYKSCSQQFWKASISSVCLYHLKIPNR